MREHYRNNDQREWFGNVGIFWGLDARWFQRPELFDEAPPSQRYRTEPPAPVKPSVWSTLVAWVSNQARL
jgi:hypothetical protein